MNIIPNIQKKYTNLILNSRYIILNRSKNFLPGVYHEDPSTKPLTGQHEYKTTFRNKSEYVKLMIQQKTIVSYKLLDCSQSKYFWYF